MRAAYMAVANQPPKAKGMHFRIQDEGGFIIILHICKRFRRAIRGSAFLEVQGVVESKGSVTPCWSGGLMISMIVYWYIDVCMRVIALEDEVEALMADATVRELGAGDSL